jgi:hypothetical protein
MGDSIPSQARQFRAAVMPMFFCVYLSVVVIAGGYEVALNRFALVWRALLVGFAAGVPVAWFGAWTLARYFPAAVSSEGLYGHSVWGVRRFIRWQDITAVKGFRILNLRWLRVYSRVDKEVVWLAMFQSRPIEFQDEIRRLAPEGSPLLNHLG